VCLPSVVEEFLKQTKVARLFMSAELFVFDDLLEADLSKAFGGLNRLDMFFPFDPCLLKKSERCVAFLGWWRDIIIQLKDLSWFDLNFCHYIGFLSISTVCADKLQLLEATFCPLVKSQNYIWYICQRGVQWEWKWGIRQQFCWHECKGDDWLWYDWECWRGSWFCSWLEQNVHHTQIYEKRVSGKDGTEIAV